MARRTSKRPTLGVGFPFPLRPVAGKLPWAEYEAAVEQSVQDILETSPGERVMRREYGAGLQDFVFAPNTAGTHAGLAAAVRVALVQSEHRIDVERVQVNADLTQPNLLLIDLDYVVRRTNSAHNRVFPFYLSEGT
ncbi:MAG: phage baseplate assembly protein W [Cognaticolwellia sp.]|jgi:phage baseplate assembly protein W